MQDKNTIILFDLDGTLLDSTDAIVSTFYHAFKTLDFDFKGTSEDIKNLIGYPLDVMFSQLNVPSNQVWDFVDAYSYRYKQISKEQTNLLPDTKQALELASSFARLSVVTTKRKEPTVSLLKYLGLYDYFEFITGRNCVNNPKPHAEPILKTLGQMNYNKDFHTAWMIGDTKLDLLSARDSHIRSVGVLCGYGKKYDLEKYTKYIKENAFEAVKLINSNSLV